MLFCIFHLNELGPTHLKSLHSSLGNTDRDNCMSDKKDILPKQSEAAAAATVGGAPCGRNDDLDAALRIQALESLVTVFGFDSSTAQKAIDAVGPDVTQAYNYILDNKLALDQGGPVTPLSTCSHLEKLAPAFSIHQLSREIFDRTCGYNDMNGTEQMTSTSARSKTVKDESGSCPKGENWLCLTCGGIFCSRYVNGHGIDHWKETRQREEQEHAVGHALAVSLADLSVWCHECQSYLVSHKQSPVRPIVQHIERLKFATEEQHQHEQHQQPFSKKPKLELNSSEKGEKLMSSLVRCVIWLAHGLDSLSLSSFCASTGRG